MRTCAQNSPACIILITAGDELFSKPGRPYCGRRPNSPPSTSSQTAPRSLAARPGGARCAARQDTHRRHAGDHIFWGPRFLRLVLLPFEINASVGLVGTHKSIRQVPGLDRWGDFCNMLGALYLTWHDFEIRASNAVDGDPHRDPARLGLPRRPEARDVLVRSAQLA